MQYIQLTQGKQAIIDDEDFEWVSRFKYHYEKQWGYARRMDKKRIIIFLHQDIARRKFGDYNIFRFRIDHINRITLDCRRTNIRLVTHSQSCHNRNAFKNKTLGKYRGVSIKPNKKWQARISYQGKPYYLGLFQTEKEAATAYNMKAKELYGEYANLNKIEGRS